MAFRSTEVTVGTTPTLLHTAVSGDLELWVNVDPNESYWIGGSDVTPSKGLALFGPNNSNTFHTRIRPGDELYAVVGTGTATANVLVRSA